MTTPELELEVRRASDLFYEALNRLLRGDPAPMLTVWAHGPDVISMHPFGGREMGWEQVRGVWDMWSSLTKGTIAAHEVIIRVHGEVAYTTSIEKAKLFFGKKEVTVDGRATNIFRRDNGQWRLIHHHADVTPAAQEAIRKLVG